MAMKSDGNEGLQMAMKECIADSLGCTPMKYTEDLRSWQPCPLGGPILTKVLRISCSRARRLGPPEFAKDLRTMCSRALAGPRRYKGTTLPYIMMTRLPMAMNDYRWRWGIADGNEDCRWQ